MVKAMKNRQDSFGDFIAQVRSKAKDDTIIQGMNEERDWEIPVIPTGIPSLDKALGVGGIPKGRIIEIFGPESGGKTTLTLQIIGSCQQHGGTAVFIDAENSLDRYWAAKLGVNLDYLAVSQPDNGEQAYDLIDMMLSMETPPDLIVIDSLPALVPQAVLDGSATDHHVGVSARMHAQNLPKFFNRLPKVGTTMILINQVREKIGGFSKGFTGPTETTPGGRTIKHAASVRINVRKGEMIKASGNFVGMKIKTTIAKNKLAGPFRKAEFTIMYEDGVDTTHDIFMNAVEHEVLIKKGGWYYFGGEKWQGQANVLEALKDDELREAIVEALKEEIEEHEHDE